MCFLARQIKRAAEPVVEGNPVLEGLARDGFWIWGCI
jgi:hypothetical protein